MIVLFEGGYLQPWSMGYWPFDKDHNKVGDCSDRLAFYVRQFNKTRRRND